MRVAVLGGGATGGRVVVETGVTVGAEVTGGDVSAVGGTVVAPVGTVVVAPIGRLAQRAALPTRRGRWRASGR